MGVFSICNDIYEIIKKINYRYKNCKRSNIYKGTCIILDGSNGMN